MSSPQKSQKSNLDGDTLKSTSVSVNEKMDMEESVRQGSLSASPSVNNNVDEVRSEEIDGGAVEKINTSAEGVEYPTGLKLGLISLALCLSVFLIALVS